MAAHPLPDPGRRAEHAPVGLADVFGPAALFLLRRAAATRESVAARGSGGGRSVDVGAGFGGVPGAALRDRHPAPLLAAPRSPRRRPKPAPGRTHVDRASPARLWPADHRAAADLWSSPRPSTSCECLSWAAFSAGGTPGSAFKSRCCCSPGSSSTMASAGRRRSHESGGRACPGFTGADWSSGVAGGRQCLLHGLSVHAAAHAGPPLSAACGRPWPRWLRNKWLAVLSARRLSVGLRGVRSLGQPVARPPGSCWLTSRPPS